MQKLLSEHAHIRSDDDPWYLKPCGILRKPDFNRSAQDIKNATKRSLFDIFRTFTHSYEEHYFVLDIPHHVLRYYKDEADSQNINNAKGLIDLKDIDGINSSTLYDAPKFSFDLISSTKHYTLSAESLQDMVRWAYVLDVTRRSIPDDIIISYKNSQKENNSTSVQNDSKMNNRHSLTKIPNNRMSIPHVNSLKKLASGKLTNNNNSPFNSPYPVMTSPPSRKESDDKNNMSYYEYEVTFNDPGPLMMNVMGTVDRDDYGNTTNHEIVVISFEYYTDGKLGRAEASGCIQLNDCITNVNGIDLTKNSFNEAMDIMTHASWPKTINFRRDTTPG